MCKKKNGIAYILILLLSVVFINSNALASGNVGKRRTRQQSKLEKMLKKKDNDNTDDESVSSDNEASESSDISVENNDESENNGFNNSNISEVSNIKTANNLEDLNNTFSKRRTRRQSKLEKMLKKKDNDNTDDESVSSDNEDNYYEEQSDGKNVLQLEGDLISQIDNNENNEIENQNEVDDVNEEVITNMSTIQTLNNEITNGNNLESNIENNTENDLNQNKSTNSNFVFSEKTNTSKQNNALLSSISQLKQSKTDLISDNTENNEIKNQNEVNNFDKEITVNPPAINIVSNDIETINNDENNIENLNNNIDVNQNELLKKSVVLLTKPKTSEQDNELLNGISQLKQGKTDLIGENTKNSEIENQNEVNNFDKEITVNLPVINIISNDAETINNEENNFENLNDNDIDLNQNELLKKSVVSLTKPKTSEQDNELLNGISQLKQGKTELIIDDTENDKNQNEVNDINKEITIDVPTVQVLGNEVADINGAKIDSNEQNNMEDNNEQNNMEDNNEQNNMENNNEQNNIENNNEQNNMENNNEQNNMENNNEQNNIDSNDSDEQKEHKESNSSDKNNEKSKQDDKNIKTKSLLYVNMHNNIIHNMLSNANITKSNKNFNFNLKYDSNINNNIIYNNETVKNRLLNASVSGKFNIVDNDIIKLDSMLFAGYNNVNYNNHYYIGLLNNIYIIDDLDISLVLNFLTNKEILKDNNIINNSFSGAINIAYKIDLSNNFTVKPGFYISYINVGKINDYKYSITNIPNVSLLFKFDKLTANFAVKYFMNNSDLTHNKLQDLNMTNGMVCSTGIDYEIFDNFNVNFNVNFNKNSTNKFNLSFGLVYSF